MKWIGVLFIMGGCFSMGYWYSARYSRRLKNLWECKKAFQILQSEIRYGRTPLPIALEQAGRRGKGVIQDFLLNAAVEIEEGGSRMEEIWKKQIEQSISEREMRKNDRILLEEVGNTLGYLDVEMQMKTLELYVQRLSQSIEEYTAEKKNRTRLYPVLGSMCGALICLVIL